MPGATQSFVQFDHIKHGVVVLKNGDLRAILEVFAMNFGLKSVEEQEAIVYAYQNFLNSLDFDLQILVHSRRMDIGPYLDELSNNANSQESPLMKSQIEEYVEFVRSFVEDSNIMAKRFFCVIPFSMVQGAKESGGITSAFSSLLGSKSSVVKVSDEHFKTARTQLMQRIEFVTRSLEQVGLKARMLDTEELLRLYWETYNPSKRDEGEYIPVDIGQLEGEDL